MKNGWEVRDSVDSPVGVGVGRREEPVLAQMQAKALTCDSATPVASLTLPNITSIWYMLQRCLSSSSLWRWWSWIVSSDCSSTCSRWVYLRVGDSQGHCQSQLQIRAWCRGQERIPLSLGCGEQEKRLGTRYWYPRRNQRGGLRTRLRNRGRGAIEGSGLWKWVG